MRTKGEQTQLFRHLDCRYRRGNRTGARRHYNHFASKDELALAAFDYASALRGRLLHERLESVANAADQLIVFAQVTLEMLASSELSGGCPVLNTAVDTDDTHPALKARAQASLRHLQCIVETTIETGITRGEIQPTTHPANFATLMVASLEGGMMMSKLNDNPLILQLIVEDSTRAINRDLRVK